MRDPLDKESFLQGIRQKWAIIFIACGATVLFVNIWIGVQFDPTPYMQFLLAIGSLFILGASGDSWVKAYSVKSIKETEVKEDTKRMEIDKTVTDDSMPDTNIIMGFDNQYANDPSYAPKDWIEEQSAPNFR